jgi:hypothetical protein
MEGKDLLLHAFLISAIGGGEWLISMSGPIKADTAALKWSCNVK